MRSGSVASLDYLRLIESRFEVGTWALDLVTQRMDWSAGFQRLMRLPTGAKPSVALLTDMIHADDRWILDDLLRPDAHDDAEHTYRVHCPDGSIRWHSCWAATIAARTGEPFTRFAVTRDVTNRQGAINRMTRLNLAFKTLAEMRAEVVFRLDPALSPYHAAAWSELTGQGYDDLRRDGWTTMVHPDDRDQATASWREARGQARRVDLAVRLFAREGGFVARRLEIAPVLSREGDVLEWIVRVLRVQDAALEPAVAPSLTPTVLRGCRGLLDWTISDLAEASGVSAATITRYELGASKDASARASTVAKLVAALQRAGVEFAFVGRGPPSIRLKV